MVESWMGVVLETFVLPVAAMLVMGHYRREHRRARLLRRMSHYLDAAQTLTAAPTGDVDSYLK
ncbi:hypothetical protein ACAX43_28515 [Paraburkholderia sp. IW21]|uniref:hypothetical protein n=1 Tax=Paraburkholderia sp. IW21 TaxID=3242488 RepID=UPI003522AF88